MRRNRKGFVALCTLIVLLVAGLAGCDWIEGFFNPPSEDPPPANPLIGEWAGTFTPTSGSPSSLTMEFKADNTFTETIVDLSVTISGTYVQDTAAKTVTVTVTASSNEGFIPIGYTSTMTYSFSTDNNTMTFTTGGQPGTGVLIRQ